MIRADLPLNEGERLRALLNYEVLDTAEEQDFDELTELASSICGKPIALVSLIDKDRQWFKSHHGLEATQTPRDFAFCAHAIEGDDIFEISDSTQDERFHDNPLVLDAPNVIFYAGAPLKTPDGFNIGTLCVIDNKPGKLTETQKRQLRLIANQVIAQLELRRNSRIKTELFNTLRTSVSRLDEQNQELYQFAHRVAHDLNGPLSNIQAFIALAVKDIEQAESEKALNKFDFIKNASTKARQLIDDLLELSRAEFTHNRLIEINFEKLLEDVLEHVNTAFNNGRVRIQTTVTMSEHFCSEPTRLKQVLYNLISNSIKYADHTKAAPYVSVSIDIQSDQHLRIIVEDNGLGIPEKDQHKIFDTFSRFHAGVAHGSGIGTTIVKKHIDALGGTITLNSDCQQTTFTITLPPAKTH